MIYQKDNRIAISKSPHSLGVQNNLTIPSPGFDENPLIINEKRWLGAGMQGLGGLTFDGTGLFGTGVFSGDIWSWGVTEVVFGLIGIYSFYAMFHQAKQTKYRAEMSAGRRRKSKAVRLRARAKKLEEKTTGIF